MPISQMEAVLKSLEQRAGRIEQILPTLATRKDMELLAVHVRGLVQQSSNMSREVAKLGKQLSSVQHDESDLKQGVSDTRQEVSRLYRRIGQMARRSTGSSAGD